MKQNFFLFKKLLRNYLLLNKKAKELARISENASDSLDILIEKLKTFNDFEPSQKDKEISYLFEIIRENEYKNLCEIGSYKGGSLFLFCQVVPESSKIISIDINYPLARKHAHKKFAKKGQRLFAIQGDTKSPDTFRKTKTALRGQHLDFLFIDGDHSLFGVMNDYIRYSPLVRKGGVIAFHDIHPDLFMRTGTKSPSYVGGVPLFWEIIKNSGARTEEMIEDHEQDGYGIGVIYKE